jgi:hypothetical protein
MTMQELFPFGCGLLLGAALGYVRPGVRLPVGGLLAIVLGVVATLVTAEFKASWGYVLVDIPLVTCATFIGLLVARQTAPYGVRRLRR